MIKVDIDLLCKKLHIGETVEIEGHKLKAKQADRSIAPCSQCQILETCISHKDICNVCVSMDYLEYVEYNNKNRYYLEKVKEEEDKQ